MLNSPRISALQPPPPPRAPTGAVALARKAAGQVGGWVQRKNAIDERKLRGQPGLGGLLVIVFETEWECRIQRMKGVLRGSRGPKRLFRRVDSDFFFLRRVKFRLDLNISRRTTSHKTLKENHTPHSHTC